jgi:phosphatidylglycerol lysyltransferase
MGFFAARHIPYQHELWWRFALEGDASRFLRAMIGAACVFIVVALAQALRPAKPLQPPPPPAGSVVDQLVRASDHADAALAYLGDKQFAIGPGESCALMYADQGRSRIVMADPLGDSDAAGDLLWQFVEQAQDEGMRPVFFQVSVSEMPRLVDMGFKLYKLGEEARVPLAPFTLEGSAGRKFRHARSRFQREGLTFEMWSPAEVAERLEQLSVVSDAWLNEHKAGEKSFSLGRFDPPFITRFPAAVVKDRAGRILAFATLWLTQNREELSVDLMRHVPDAPNGVMEGMFVEIMLWGQAEGYAHFNLGMAPLSGLSTHPLAPLWHQMAAMIFHKGESLYNFRGVRGYKEKFNPIWEPRYLAVPGSWSLPTALLDTTALIGGGIRRTLGYKG